MLNNNSNPVTVIGAGTDSQNQEMVGVVLNRYLIGEHILEKVAILKNLEIINSGEDISPMDLDLISILEIFATYPDDLDDDISYDECEYSDHHTSSRISIEYVPKGTKFILLWSDPSDGYYAQEQFIIISENVVFTA